MVTYISELFLFLKISKFIVTDNKQSLQGPLSPLERSLLSQRLLEILSKTDPLECENELRKLKRELDSKS